MPIRGPFQGRLRRFMERPDLERAPVLGAHPPPYIPPKPEVPQPETAQTGSYYLTGPTVNLARTYLPLVAQTGVYSLAGQDVTLQVITGSAPTVYTLDAEPGIYHLWGDLGPEPLAAQPGIYTLSGPPVNLSVISAQLADTGVYTLVGPDVTLTYVPANSTAIIDALGASLLDALGNPILAAA